MSHTDFPVSVGSDPVLIHLRVALNAVFGTRIERVVLFGSRARGEAGPDSDYDIALFLHGFADRRTEAKRLAEIETDLLYQKQALVTVLPFAAGAYRKRTPLMAAIRRDGIDL